MVCVGFLLGIVALYLRFVCVPRSLWQRPSDLVIHFHFSSPSWESRTKDGAAHIRRMNRFISLASLHLCLPHSCFSFSPQDVCLVIGDGENPFLSLSPSLRRASCCLWVSRTRSRDLARMRLSIFTCSENVNKQRYLLGITRDLLERVNRISVFTWNKKYHWWEIAS